MMRTPEKKSASMVSADSVYSTLDLNPTLLERPFLFPSYVSK